MAHGASIASSDLQPDVHPSAEDAQDFCSFFLAHRPALSAFLRRRLATDADVQEVLQESYARVLGYGYGGSRPPAVWKSLLYRIASNLSISRMRTERAHNVAGQQSLDDVELPSDSPSQERVLAAQQELELIRQAIVGLSPKCRKVFLLSRTHHKTYPEIAQLCGISVKMVEKYVSQALAALRQAVGGRP